jgi:hypothetical protein
MDIIGYEDYLIYDDGRVYSKKNKIFLKPGINSHGYLQIGLSKNGKRNTHKIHRLIGLHYIPNPENKKCIDHKNRIRTDNRIKNLRWATDSENGQNQSIRIDNTSGHQHISYNKRDNRYTYKKMINYKTHSKSFKTLSEAIQYKEELII